MSINSVNGANGNQYDKNEIRDVMLKDSAEVTEIVDEDGRHIDIFDPETNTLHTLVDLDNDGTIDAYRKQIRNSNNNSLEVLDDVDFDGTFDKKLDGKNMGDGNYTCAIDYDNDGNIDEYKYMTDDLKF